ncbi:hypothetical protein FA95DRAFT_1563434 [Auriscalpium vulgare]|uniref:Uncharacterized protein n=1 Tax=Auriscalpium vulgare TaxID=40419 RepID=A0ACB8RGH4_9AGAM|nr:hypothetical protein FA95DRAFT_1563434 [Auriscalpium vulgare]
MSDYTLSHPPTTYPAFHSRFNDQDEYGTLPPPPPSYTNVSVVVGIKGIQNPTSSHRSPQYIVSDSSTPTFPSSSTAPGSFSNPLIDTHNQADAHEPDDMDYSPQMLSQFALDLPPYGDLNPVPDVYPQHRPSHQQPLHAPLPNTPIDPWYLEAVASAASGIADPRTTAAANLAMLQAGLQGSLYPPAHDQHVPQNYSPPHAPFETLATNTSVVPPGPPPPTHSGGNLAAWGVGMGVSGSLDPSTGVFSRTVEHPRMRTAQACEKCRTRKAKCSGDHPTCQRCLTRGLVCEYAPERKMRGPNKPKPLGAPTTTSRRTHPSSPSDSASSPGSEKDSTVRKRANTLPSLPGPAQSHTSPKTSPLTKHAVIPRGDEKAEVYGIPQPPFTNYGGSQVGMASRKARPPPLDVSGLHAYDGSRVAKIEYEESPMFFGDAVATQNSTPHMPPAPPPSTPAGLAGHSPRRRSTSATSLAYPTSEGSPVTPRSLLDGMAPMASEKDRAALLRAVEGMESEGVEFAPYDAVRERHAARVQ